MYMTRHRTLYPSRFSGAFSEASNSSPITFTPIDISNAFKSLKIGKACGVDGVSAEHFLYAHDILHVFLSGYLHLSLLMVIYHPTL